MRILGIIPARAGSKRLPRKNLKELCGKPLITWTIESALEVAELAQVMVTTDSTDIANIAKGAGAEVPFIRPPHLATDTSTTIDVVRHALDYYKKKGQTYDFVLLLQPTSPTRRAYDIRKAIQQAKEFDADAIISVCKCEHSPLWTNSLPADLSMDEFISPLTKNQRSQDLPPYYRLNGAIYLTKAERLIEENSFILNKKTYAFVMNNESSIDIDDPLDFMIAEAILTNSQK